MGMGAAPLPCIGADALITGDTLIRTLASACMRIESVGVFAVIALLSNERARLFNLSNLPLLLCESSAL